MKLATLRLAASPLYAQSQELALAPTDTPPTNSSPIITLDVAKLYRPITRWLALRAEASDNFSSPPVYNVPAGKQHNLSLTAAFAVRWDHSFPYPV